MNVRPYSFTLFIWFDGKYSRCTCINWSHFFLQVCFSEHAQISVITPSVVTPSTLYQCSWQTIERSVERQWMMERTQDNGNWWGGSLSMSLSLAGSCTHQQQDSRTLIIIHYYVQCIHVHVCTVSLSIQMNRVQHYVGGFYFLYFCTHLYGPVRPFSSLKMSVRP